MAFRETCPVEERIALFNVYESGAFTVVELCERYNISRETFYVWKRRRDAGGDNGFGTNVLLQAKQGTFHGAAGIAQWDIDQRRHKGRRQVLLLCWRCLCQRLPFPISSFESTGGWRERLTVWSHSAEIMGRKFSAVMASEGPLVHG